MAKAVVINIPDGYVDGSNNFSLSVTVIYAGADVPGTFQKVSLGIDISAVTTIGGLATTIATAVRNWAANSSSFTVPANQVFLPSYSAQ